MSDTRSDLKPDTAEELTAGPETAPGPDRPRRGPAPALGLRGGLRFLWTQLTSMRTALVLLFALAVAAIPGSVVPQRKVSPVSVDDFIEKHPTLGPIYDTVGLFSVYTSPWFSAIYLLLFVSLVGCIVPRVAVYAKAVRARPVRTPRNLSRLPVHRQAGVSADEAETVLDRAVGELRRRRYRVSVRSEDPMGPSVSAERGYLREAGNLVFHVSLLFVLLGVAVGGLTGFRGTSVVVVGQGFSNNLSQYDDFTGGGAFDEGQLAPFSLLVDKFDVAFETGPVQTGAARLFRAQVDVTDEPGEQPHTETLEVNHPLRVDGTTVHLIGHGYAPRVTVKDAQGNVAFSGPVVFLPQDGNFTSAGVIKAPDGRPDRLAFQGLFLPTAQLTAQGPQSIFPDLIDPQLFLNAWTGPPQAETGQSESVYTLDTTGMTQVTDPKKPGQPLRFILRPGFVQQLPNGQGSIQLDGVDRWVKLQVGDTPGVPIALVAIGVAVFGLCLSLFIRPRRVWVRIRPGGAAEDEGADLRLVEIAGLDRADARTGLDEDVGELAEVLGLNEQQEAKP